MEGTGARWSLDGAEAVLKLRALAGNCDFDKYFAFHLKQEKRATTTAFTSSPSARQRDQTVPELSYLQKSRTPCCLNFWRHLRASSAGKH
jgi:hypothetical protein